MFSFGVRGFGSLLRWFGSVWWCLGKCLGVCLVVFHLFVFFGGGGEGGSALVFFESVLVLVVLGIVF